MTSTPTTRGKYRKQGLGDNLNTWGLNNGLNGNADRYDEALHGVNTIALTANYTLTTTNYASNDSRYAVLDFTGTALTAGVTVTIPATENNWLMDNNAGFTLEISNGAATASLPSGLMSLVYTDGTDIVINPLPADATAVTALARHTAEIVTLGALSAELVGLGALTAQIISLGAQTADLAALGAQTAALRGLGDQTADLRALGDQTADIATVAANIGPIKSAANLVNSAWIVGPSAAVVDHSIVLYAGTSGRSATATEWTIGAAGDLNGAGNVMRDVTLAVFSINSGAVAGASAATAFTADFSVANKWVHEPQTSVTYHFAGFETANATSLQIGELQIVGGGDHVIGYSFGGTANVQFPGGNAPTLSTGVVLDILTVEPTSTANVVVSVSRAGVE